MLSLARQNLNCRFLFRFSDIIHQGLEFEALEFDVKFTLVLDDSDDDDNLPEPSAVEDPDYVDPEKENTPPEEVHIPYELKCQAVSFWRSPQTSNPFIKTKRPKQRLDLRAVQKHFRFVTSERQLYRLRR